MQKWLKFTWILTVVFTNYVLRICKLNYLHKFGALSDWLVLSYTLRRQKMHRFTLLFYHANPKWDRHLLLYEWTNIALFQWSWNQSAKIIGSPNRSFNTTHVMNVQIFYNPPSYLAQNNFLHHFVSLMWTHL
jgi:hypothetical protein